MCFQATCPTCHGVTWKGCGKHIPNVMDSVPKDKWCTCPKPESSPYPPGATSNSCITH